MNFKTNKDYLYKWELYEYNTWLGHKECVDGGTECVEAKNYREAKKLINSLYEDEEGIVITMIAEVKYMKSLPEFKDGKIVWITR